MSKRRKKGIAVHRQKSGTVFKSVLHFGELFLLPSSSNHTDLPNFHCIPRSGFTDYYLVSKNNKSGLQSPVSYKGRGVSAVLVRDRQWWEVRRAGKVHRVCVGSTAIRRPPRRSTDSTPLR